MLNQWRCHVCREMRPDAAISVHTKKKSIKGVSFDENIRYCNDKELCRAGALDVNFTSAPEEE